MKALRLKIHTDSRKYGFKVGDEFMVIRKITGDCVIIMPDDKTPSIVMDDGKIRKYGYLR